jgi:hypothetical protein
MDDIIAEQLLYFDGDVGRRVLVRLGRPRRSGPAEYGCQYEIETAIGAKKRVAYGVDSVQALDCAFIMIGGEIAYLERSADSRIVHLNGEKHSFPEPGGSGR